MEALLVGAIGLGGIYAIAQSEKDAKKKEAMQTISNLQNAAGSVSSNNNFSQPESATSMYMDQSRFQEMHETTSGYQQQLSNNNAYSSEDEIGQQSDDKAKTLMSGELYDANEFTHNNMVPYFGGKIRGATADLNQSEILLDHKAGAGTHHIENSEPAPLFRPEDNMQLPHGMQNHSDFFQSRVNPSMNISNVKPWEEVQVGPGLGKGFTADGSSGFNSGMESRDAWLPKNVNELRTVTNPKVTYGLTNHEGPAMSKVTNIGVIGEVNKHQPDTYYHNSPERYFTTTGAEKAQTARAIEKLKEQNRIDTTREYQGPSGNGMVNVAKAPENYRDPVRDHVYGEQMGAAGYAENSYPATEGDYGRLGYKVLPNNRATTKPDGEIAGIGGAIGAVIAPIMDMLRPSRKENAIGSARMYGSVQKTGAGGEYVYNRNHTENRVRTTHKESYVDSPYHLNIENQNNGAYLVTKQQPVRVQRDTTNTEEMGVAAAPGEGIHLQDMYRKQRNNCNKKQAPSQNHGNMNLFNNEVNVELSNRCLPQQREFARGGGPNGITPSVEQMGIEQSIPQGLTYNSNTLGNDRINPDLLNAFKQNPYTQSLSSY